MCPHPFSRQKNKKEKTEQNRKGWSSMLKQNLTKESKQVGEDYQIDIQVAS